MPVFMESNLRQYANKYGKVKKMAKKTTAILLAILTAAMLFSGCDVLKETFDPEVQPSATASQLDEETWMATMDLKSLPQMEGIQSVPVMEWDESYLIYAVYPSVDEKEAVSSDMAGFVQDKIDQFKEEVAGGKGQTVDGDKPYLNVTYEPFAYEDAVISFKVVTDADSGLTRTNGFINTFVYSMGNEDRLSLGDVFDSSTDYLNVISGLVRSKLEGDTALEGNYDAALFEEGTAPAESNFSDFVVGDGVVVFYFNANQIAPSEAGSFEVSLTFDELNDVMVQDVIHPYAPVSVNAATGEDLPEYMLAGDGDMSAFSIEGIDPDDKVVALTFDDGPNPSTTGQILDALEQYGGVATFFLLGQLAEEYPETVQRIYESGNEIGNHSYDHADFKQISTDAMMDEVDSTNQIIYDIVGARPIIVRPPYGNITDSMAEEIGRACILWTVDPEDWKYKDTEIDYDNVMSVVRDGDIVLMHDIYQPTADAAVRIIRDLTDQGYKLVTVTQLMQIAQARGLEPTLIVRNGARD